jgi:hypothetical protein
LLARLAIEEDTSSLAKPANGVWTQMTPEAIDNCNVTCVHRDGGNSRRTAALTGLLATIALRTINGFVE